jgi:hypothetical protein
MKTFLSEEALVAAYWRRLARSIDPAGGGERKKPSLLKSRAGSGVRQRFAASRNVKPAIPTRSVHGSRKNHAADTRRVKLRTIKEEAYA